MKIGVLGATGEVGRTIIKVLEERSVIIDDLVLLSSERSAGHSITYQNTPNKV
jgi:aspartate-semialdehyde dehydrogenase